MAGGFPESEAWSIPLNLPGRNAARILPWWQAKTAVGSGEFLHKLETTKFHDEPTLVGVEKVIDFRLADWLIASIIYRCGPYG
jgi:hypothetical protein